MYTYVLFYFVETKLLINVNHARICSWNQHSVIRVNFKLKETTGAFVGVRVHTGQASTDYELHSITTAPRPLPIITCLYYIHGVY